MPKIQRMNAISDKSRAFSTTAGERNNDTGLMGEMFIARMQFTILCPRIIQPPSETLRRNPLGADYYINYVFFNLRPRTWRKAERRSRITRSIDPRKLY